MAQKGTPVSYRVGRKQPQNIYRNNDYIGVMFNPEDAALVVQALNDNEPTDWPAFARQQLAIMKDQQEELPDDLTYEEQYQQFMQEAMSGDYNNVLTTAE
jgi:hypothetical protein